MIKINHMNDLFFNKTNIERIIKNICFIDENNTDENNKYKNNKYENKPDIKTESNSVIVNDKDKLFWFWYIFEYGYNSYEMLGKNTYKTEMKHKTRLVEIIHKEKKNLKKFKFKLNDIEQDILYSKNISIKSFMVILFLNKINLIYYTDVVFYENINFDRTIVIYHNKSNNIYEMKENENIETIKNEKYIITSLDKKIKAISKYKADDIKNIAKILNIDIMKSSNKTFTKKELYEKILQKIS